MDRELLLTLLSEPQIIDDLLIEIHKTATKEGGGYDYGLPLYEAGKMAELELVVLRWITKTVKEKQEK